MMDLPDAPWIRDAEINGMPEAEDVYCPVCGAENPEDFWVDDTDEVIGCTCCLHRRDPWQYMADRKDNIRRCWA